MSARDFAYAFRSVVGCDSCVSAMTMPQGPIPAHMAGQVADVRLGLIWDQPQADPTMDAKAHRLMQILLQEAGVDWKAYATFRVAGCVGGKTEVENCRRHLEAQMYSFDNMGVVMLMGGAAVKQWRGDVTITANRGVVGMMLDRWIVVVCDNPINAINRYGDTKAVKDNLRRDIETARGIVWEGYQPHLEGMFTCNVKTCKYDAEHWDRDGVGYCFKHVKDNATRWRKERKQWDKRKAISLQPRLQLDG